jgi:hypothetical protein
MSPFTSKHGRRSTNDAHGKHHPRTSVSHQTPSFRSYFPATKSFLEHAIRPPNNTFLLGSFNSASSVHHITSFPHSTSLFPSNMHACFSSSFSLGIFPTPSNILHSPSKKENTAFMLPRSAPVHERFRSPFTSFALSLFTTYRLSSRWVGQQRFPSNSLIGLSSFSFLASSSFRC